MAVLQRRLSDRFTVGNWQYKIQRGNILITANGRMNLKLDPSWIYVHRNCWKLFYIVDFSLHTKLPSSNNGYPSSTLSCSHSSSRQNGESSMNKKTFKHNIQFLVLSVIPFTLMTIKILGCSFLCIILPIRFVFVIRQLTATFRWEEGFLEKVPTKVIFDFQTI